MLSATAFNTYIADIRARSARLSASKLDDLDVAMAIDFEEHYEFQETQSQMHASGILSTEAALIVYKALGHTHNQRNGGWADRVDTATKVAVTKLMEELLAMKIKVARQTLVEEVV